MFLNFCFSSSVFYVSFVSFVSFVHMYNFIIIVLKKVFLFSCFATREDLRGTLHEEQKIEKNPVKLPKFDNFRRNLVSK